MRNSLLFSIPLIIVITGSVLIILSIPSKNQISNLELKIGNKYQYYVDCVDFCGDKQWDATEVDGRLLFEIFDITNEDIVITTSYNSSTPIERNYTGDYGNFTYNEIFDLNTRYNNQNSSYAWQFINQGIIVKREMNISIPWMFVPHAPEIFKSNIITVESDSSEDKGIEINKKFVEIITFTGEWIYSYIIQLSNVTVTVEVEIGYEVVSGVMIEIKIDVNAVQEFIGLIPLDPNYDAVDSFKANLLFNLVT